ncbi:MAG: response regulator, partial [Planctomycetota bacterium]
MGMNETALIRRIPLDVRMAGIEGYSVLKQLKEKVVTNDILVIFVTAMESTEDETKGFELGAVDYITKPIQPTTLLARV